MRGWTLSAKMSDSKPARAQVPLDGQRLVADGVAVGEGGQELVDAPRRGRAHSAPASRPAPAAPATIASSVFSRRAWNSSARPAAAGSRLLEVLHLEVQARHLQARLCRRCDVGGVQVRLARQGGDHRGRVPEQLLHRAQPARRTASSARPAPPRLLR